MRLTRKQRCPLHPRQMACVCRGDVARQFRKPSSKWETVRPGVRRIKDEHADHPDGYRYKLSPAEMRKVVDRKIQEQNGLCSIGGESLTDYTDVVPDHKLPKGSGGGRRDDRAENIGAACSRHNLEKGSRRDM